MAVRESACNAACLQATAWARLRALLRSRDAARAGASGARARRLPPPLEPAGGLAQPLALALRDCAASLARAFASTGRLIGGVLGGWLAAGRVLLGGGGGRAADAKLHAERALPPSPSLLESVGGALAALPSMCVAAWSGVVEALSLSLLPLPESWRQAAEHARRATRDAVVVASSKGGSAAQILIWSQARGSTSAARSRGLTSGPLSH
jgi:hypothetical protein